MLLGGALVNLELFKSE